MKLDGSFGMLETILDLGSARHKALAENVANMDTPGYKARDVAFEKVLLGKMGEGITLATTNPGHISMGDTEGGITLSASGDGEEQGLFGSKHLAEVAKEQGWDIEAVLNNDIVGGDTTPGEKLQDHKVVRVFSEPVPADATPQQVRELLMLGYGSDSPSREEARAVTEVARSYAKAYGPDGFVRPVLEFRLDRFLRGGDHYSFNQEGFPAIRFTEWRENFHHQHQNVRMVDGVQYGDLPQFVDFHYVAKVARINGTAMASLATAPPPPVDVKVVVSKLDNNSELEWKNGPGAPKDTHYIVVWRPTAAPDWTRQIDAAQLAHVHDGAYRKNADGSYVVTVPVSKDNVIFGVEAVGAHGQRSTAVVPMPTR